MTRKILSEPKKEVKRAMFNFRLTEIEAKQLRDKLKADKRKASDFFISVVRAYINGKIS